MDSRERPRQRLSQCPSELLQSQGCAKSPSESDMQWYNIQVAHWTQDTVSMLLRAKSDGPRVHEPTWLRSGVYAFRQKAHVRVARGEAVGTRSTGPKQDVVLHVDELALPTPLPLPLDIDFGVVEHLDPDLLGCWVMASRSLAMSDLKNLFIL